MKRFFSTARKAAKTRTEKAVKTRSGKLVKTRGGNAVKTRSVLAPKGGDQAKRPKVATFSNNLNVNGPLLGPPFRTRFPERVRGNAGTTIGGQTLHEESFMTCFLLRDENTVKTCTGTVVETRGGNGGQDSHGKAGQDSRGKGG